MSAACRRLPLCLLLLLGIASPAGAQGRGPLTLAVGGPAARWRPAVVLRGLERDGALREALQSGLPLRFHFRIELWRKDVFDRLEQVQEVSRALLRSPLEEGFVLEDGRTERRFATFRECEAALEEAFAGTVHPAEPGRYYYLATLKVETFSLSDLEELRRWLRGEARPAVQGRVPPERAVERGLRRFFIRLLGLPTREYRARSPSFRTDGG
ncbi:MAG TPA: hypothetical protein VFX98_09755 [Longimicrobiaceae bacterium]|nr:hypothetical protein [Longimicrobiaceae bacterium]